MQHKLKMQHLRGEKNKKKQQLSEAHHVSRFIQVRKFSTQNWKKNPHPHGGWLTMKVAWCENKMGILFIYLFSSRRA